jgi:hypothetical protein
MSAALALLKSSIQGNQIPAYDLNLPTIGDIFMATFRASICPRMASVAPGALPGLDAILVLGFLLPLLRSLQ